MVIMVFSHRHRHLQNSLLLFRDLKPENCLLYPDGHICLTDFGAAKDLGDGGQQTATFCGATCCIFGRVCV